MRATEDPRPTNGFGKEVHRTAERKLRARRGRRRSVWFGLGALGVVGWSIVVPTLVGLAVGMWLDRGWVTGSSFTLMFLGLGLLIGCVQAWQWVAEQHREIFREDKGRRPS